MTHDCRHCCHRGRCTLFAFGYLDFFSSHYMRINYLALQYFFSTLSEQADFNSKGNALGNHCKSTSKSCYHSKMLGKNLSNTVFFHSAKLSFHLTSDESLVMKNVSFAIKKTINQSSNCSSYVEILRRVGIQFAFFAQTMNAPTIWCVLNEYNA